jgi:hypothetical protein
MEDLWLVQSSAVDMKDLADLAEYHRFLSRFRSEEESANRRELLYGDARLGPAETKNQKL